MSLDFRIDHIVDAVRSGYSDRIRYDDATAFIERELRQVRTKVYEVQYTDLVGMALIPPDDEPTDPGAIEFTYTFEDRVGAAKLGATMATNPPRVDVDRQEVSPIKVRHIDLAYGWTIAEMRSAVFANRPLSMSRASACRKAMATLHDDIILLGDGTAPYLGLRGLANLSGVLTHTIALGASASKLWSTKNGREIFADIAAVVSKPGNNSGGVEVADTLVLAEEAFMTAANTPWGVDSTLSALDYFLAQRRKIVPNFEIKVADKFKTAGTGGTNLMVAYRRNPPAGDVQKIARVDPIEFEQQPPQIQGNETVINCHAQTAGVYTPFPGSICTAYGF